MALANVPSSVPSSTLYTIPPQLVSYIAVSSFVSVPSNVPFPTSWNPSSAVILPLTWVDSLPSDQVIVISSEPSAAIVSWNNVPESVPTSVIWSIPTSAIQSVPVSSWTLPSFYSSSVSPNVVRAACNFLAE